MKFFTRLKESVKKFVHVTKSYFTRENLREGLSIASSFVGMHLLEYYVTNFLVEKSREENIDPNKQYLAVIGNVILTVSIFSLRFATIQYLTSSLESNKRKELAKRLLKNKSLVGVEFVHDKELSKEGGPAEKDKASAGAADSKASAESTAQEILSTHTRQFSQGAVAVSIDSLSTLVSMVISFNSAAKAVNNNNIVLFSSAFALVTAMMCQVINRKKEKIEEVNMGLDEKFNGRVIHIDQNKNQVASLRAEEHELNILLDALHKKEGSFNKIFVIDFSNMGVLGMAFFGFPIIIKTVAPALSLISDKELANKAVMDFFATQMTIVMAYFRDLIMTYGRTYSKMRISMDQIYKFEKRLEQWETFYNQHNALHRGFSGEDFRIEDLSLAIPKRSKVPSAVYLGNFSAKVEATLGDPEMQLLKAAAIKFEPGRVYRLSGKSGLGKSTLLKAMTGLWPYVAGKINYPCCEEEVYFIPQNPIFPINCTLLDAILYPLGHKSGISKEKVTEWMQLLDLEDHIPDLEKERMNWDHLSRGQQQRFSVIRALLNQPKPKILLMDEGTASIDPKNKRLIEAIIRSEHFCDLTIIYVDHNPSGDASNLQEHGDVKMAAENTQLHWMVRHDGACDTIFFAEVHSAEQKQAADLAGKDLKEQTVSVRAAEDPELDFNRPVIIHRMPDLQSMAGSSNSTADQVLHARMMSLEMEVASLETEKSRDMFSQATAAELRAYFLAQEQRNFADFVIAIDKDTKAIDCSPVKKGV